MLLVPWALGGMIFLRAQSFEEDRGSLLRGWIVDRLSEAVKAKKFPHILTRSDDGPAATYTLDYTIDWNMQREVEKLFRAYKPDYGAMVVISAETGKIRALATYEREELLDEHLALRASFPAASVFKIVTAATAIDRRRADPETRILFNGGSHTLYKRNVMNETVNRWTRAVTLREAFAQSFNTAFGRLAFKRMEPSDLEDYAIRFGFNREIRGDIHFEAGFTLIPKEKNFALAEIASGFNKITRMSPLQGALMAAAIANDGAMPAPLLIEKVWNEEGEVLLQAQPRVDRVVLSAEGVEKMKVLMAETIRSGTSRRAFRPVRRDRKLKELELGGKTGTLTGVDPKGRTDWFVGYAIGENGEKLAISAVTVHVDLWRVKSSVLAQSLVKTYFKKNIDWIAQHNTD